MKQRKSLGGAEPEKEPVQVERSREKGPPSPSHTCSKALLPTGSTLLNLALRDTPYGGYVKGTVVNIIGDRSAGKTFLVWTMFAEMIKAGKVYAAYRLIYDEPEAALQFALENLFGKKIKQVVLEQSDTIQDYYKRVMKELRSKKPVIDCLDSFDSLTSEEELERDGVGKGGYKTEKAIASGEILRQTVREVKNTESLIIVISQTRENIGVSFGSKKTRSGGKALGFYNTHEIWLRVVKPIKRKDRDVGVSVEARIKKNKYTGKLRQVEFDILFDYGVDDVGSMIDWMIKEKFWKKAKGDKTGIINTQGDFIDGNRNTLISHIEDNEDERELIALVAEHWREIESDIKTDRKPRYE